MRSNNKDYLFTSERLGFRNWEDQDMAPMSALNADSDVMRYFPSTQTAVQTADFIKRMQNQFQSRGYCYFAVDRLADQTFIGFIGLCYQDYEADFTPCIDIGWRLAKPFWGYGYATEGAKECLRYAFEQLSTTEIHAVATANNLPSIHVMSKIGMSYCSTFDHPALLHSPTLKSCVLYRITKGQFRNFNDLTISLKLH